MKRPEELFTTSRLAVFGLACGLVGFLAIALDVLDGETSAFDRTLILALRDPSDLSHPIGPNWLNMAAQDITSLGSFTVLLLVSILSIGFVVATRKQAAALLIGVSVGGGMIASMALKAIFERPRPDLVSHIVQVHTASFPSGHAMLSALTYLTLGALMAKVQPRRDVKIYIILVAVFLTLAIGMSRVYLGVHWPTDVLAGWCVGSAWAIGCWLIARALQRRGEIEKDMPAPQTETIGRSR